MHDEFDINCDQIARESIDQVITAGRITLRLGIMSIRAARVIISAIIARHEHREELQDFARRYGRSFGFLEIQTEDRKLLSRFENELRRQGVAYSRLPDLQAGDGRTQYLYDLDALDKLSAIIHRNEETRLRNLDELKKTYVADPENFGKGKKVLDASTPGITLITAEDYAATSVRGGRDTREFMELEASAEKELGKSPRGAELSSGSEIRDFFGQMSGGKHTQTLQTKASRKDGLQGKVLIPETPVKRKSR